MTKNGFKKIDSVLFEYEVSKEIEEKIDKLVVELSCGDPDVYLNIHNMTLFDTMLTRYIASKFIESKIPIESHFGFVTIKVSIPGQARNFKVTVGDMIIAKDKSVKLCGTLYDL